MKRIHRDNQAVQQGNRFFVYFIFVCLLFPVQLFSVPDTTASLPQLAPPHRDGWELLDSGVTQNLNSISFVCLNRGSVVGNEGVILTTGDGGNSWTAQDSGVTTNLYDVFYFGYFVTVAVGASGTILFTNNSGQNWIVKQTGMMGTYYSGQMISDMIGVAVGVNAIFQPFFTRTNDGWNTWQSTSFYIEQNTVFYEGRLTDVFFINESVGFATAIVDVPVGGAIVRTTNGGSIWETIYFSDTRLFGIDFTADGVGYAVGDQGVILQTLNGGQSWEQLESGVASLLHAIDFSSEGTGTSVGDNGMILRTENAGITWVQQTSGTTSHLLNVQFITENIGVAVGEHGVILQTTTGGFPEDTTPPQTTCTLTGTLEGDVYVSDVTVTFSATDDLSGVAETMFKLDDDPWTPYGEPFLVSSDGIHILHFYSLDNAGNIEEQQTCEFTIQHPLNLTISILGGAGIKVTVMNHGCLDLTNVSWDMLLEGGRVFLGKQKSGQTSIKAGSDITLRFFVFGFGKPTITFTVASCQKIVQSSVFLFFIWI